MAAHDGATEAGDDAADGSYFYLRGGVSDEVNVSVADAAFDDPGLLRMPPIGEIR